MWCLDTLDSRNGRLAERYFRKTTPLHRLQRRLSVLSLIDPTEKVRILAAVASVGPREQAIVADRELEFLRAFAHCNKTAREAISPEEAQLPNPTTDDWLALLRWADDGSPLAD